MDALQTQDVPCGNDWDSAPEAAAYGEAADRARPWRSEIRDHIAARVATLAPHARVLELGSGPGARFANVHVELAKNGLVLYVGERTA